MERERIAEREVGQEGVVDDASTINDGYTRLESDFAKGVETPFGPLPIR